MKNRLALSIFIKYLLMICFLLTETSFSHSSEPLINDNGENKLKSKEFSSPLISESLMGFELQKFLVSRKGEKLYTSDGGKSWTLLGDDNSFKDFIVKKADGKLMKTDNAGFSWAYILSNEGKINSIFPYPNPASDKIQIISKDECENLKFIRVYNSQGNMVSKQMSGEKKMIIDIHNLETGIYFILGEFENGNRAFTKFIKE